MRTTTTIAETREAIAGARSTGKVVGFVPTMGFLHAGHLSLIDAARAQGATFVVVSIFVNPKQFGPTEDFSRYPRDEAHDRELLGGKDVDILFMPPVGEMYPAGAQTTVTVTGAGRPLEGERRPGHFDGVATVVLKLFNIVQPDLAVFGRKDAQQCAVIERMTRDLDVPVRLVFGETERESDGLALSSRNTYLSSDERRLAPRLHQALRAGEGAIRRGTETVGEVEAVMRATIQETPGMEIDYLSVVDPRTFLPPSDFRSEVLIAGAVRIGRTRLIDNLVVGERR
jgi:pantoate--beta-alanine ligase